jgi:hypothetical protein
MEKDEKNSVFGNSIRRFYNQIEETRERMREQKINRFREGRTKIELNCEE